MIAWTPKFPKRERPKGYLRLLLARYKYYDHYSISKKGKYRFGLKLTPGYQTRIAALRNKYKDKRCFIICNGPSLKKMDLSILRNEITIGCNAIYKAFLEWGFHTDFLLFEDIEQTELRRNDIVKIKGPIKLAALYNAYAFKADENTIFFNSPRLVNNTYYWTEIYPQFSKDFSAVAHLGGSVTYLMLQVAYHLGCNPVYIIGLDHNYGELPKLFPPGKITITKKNIHLVRGLHFDNKYYKIGDQIGVPWVKEQEQAYSKARKELEKEGRKVFNAGVDSRLRIFEGCDFKSIFQTTGNQADDKDNEHDHYKVSREFYTAIKQWNRNHPSAKNRDFLDKLDKYHLSTNLSGDKRIEQIESVLNSFGASIKGTRFLDLGCGMGGTLMGAYNMGALYFEGWEINDDKIKLGLINIRQKGNGNSGKIIKKSIEERFPPEEKNNHFQVVVCDEVLEHVKYLDRAVLNIAHCIDPKKGFAFIRIPNGYSIQSVIKDQHLLVFGLTLLNNYEAKPLAEAIKGHPSYSEMMGEYKHYDDYVTLFNKKDLKYIPLHTVPLDLKNFFDLKNKLHKIQILKKELLAKWKDRVPRDTLDLLNLRLSDYIEVVSARLKNTEINFEQNESFTNLLRDYWLNTYDFMVFHEQNETIKEYKKLSMVNPKVYA